jgi:hypothetical protein
MNLTVRTVARKRTRRTRKAWRWKYRGLCATAKKLGVTYRHLHYVLDGDRTSPRLLRAARKLMKIA